MPKQYVVAQLNAKLQPMHRGEFFEDPLDAELKSLGLGEVSGGGTLQSKIGEVEYCHIEMEVESLTKDVENTVLEALVRLGAPRGSKLIVESEERELPFGEAEGLAVYLNGTDLATEVYEQCDSSFVYSEFERLLVGAGRVLSYWQGPIETAFYMYGESFAQMRERLSEFLKTYPLCAKARVVQVA